MTENQYAQRCLSRLVTYVLSKRGGQLDGLAYEKLAYQIGRRDKQGKGAARGMGRILSKLGHMLLDFEGVWQKHIPCIQCLVVKKSGRNRGLPDDGIKEFWPRYPHWSREQKQARVRQEQQEILNFGDAWKNVLNTIRCRPRIAARDEKALCKAARLLCNELDKRCQANGFQVKRDASPMNSFTDGWYISFGLTADKCFEAQLWLDRYARQTERRFYYGFRIRKAGTLKQLLKNVSPPFNKPARTFTQKDFEKIKAQRNWWLDKRLPHHNFGKPIYEDYWEGHRFYGIYDASTKWFPNALSQIAAQAANFFSAVICSKTKAIDSKEASQVYPQLEPLVRRKHLARERSSKLAKACKERDGYRCRVCDCTFEEIYGELGRGFAESHHLYPLQRIKLNVKTRLEDLVTVCANCHRMLHLMRGREHDLVELKRIMTSQRTTT